MKQSNKFTLLALGIVGLSALAASPASAQNASACRSSVGVLGDFAQRCMVKPEGNLGTAILSSVNAVGAAQSEANGKFADDWLYNHDVYTSTDAHGNHVVSVYKDGNLESRTIFAKGGGGQSRITTSRTPSRTSVAAAPTYSTTTTKSATGQTITTNDHRIPGGVAPKPNSPPPAAANGSMNNANTQSTQTSMARDHRH
jgi:hypothetical protein